MRTGLRENTDMSLEKHSDGSVWETIRPVRAFRQQGPGSDVKASLRFKD